ncbi:GTP-binding protein [Entamoeba marina]
MEHKFKVCVFGSQGSGKTSLIRRLTTDYFFEAMQQEQTCMKKKYTIEDVEVEMLVHEYKEKKHKKEISSFLNGVDCVFFIFRLDDVESFCKICDFIQLVEKSIPFPKHSYLIGTKNDVDPEIEENEACVLASDLSLHYRNVSSKTSDGFKQLHEELEKDITATLHKRMESTEKGKTKKK